ncbi:aspartate:alanine exchanger family transporter [Sulfurovum sp. NBC37-1]|uniref:aspartate:alanine exchanger family transporter n=1 Tax=Sulfurovum sp. (strain NBC37-1) TaxID=387093 RepID=UPI000158763A|nr:TrkA C-terminal domain-containing protein [Sulfurovum sp. NBC37-1]BAF71861.1 permease [Sulfurovum sp. NBC37-1]
MRIENIDESILPFLHNHLDLSFFLVLGIGYLIGKIRFGSVSLGSVAGVLFAGLIFGYFGFKISSSAQMIGFSLFIFSVGYQAGPGFVAVLKQDGLKYFALAVVVATTGFLIAAAWAYFLALPPGMSAGLLSGGLTSSPTLAAAQDAVQSGSVTMQEGWSNDQLIKNMSMGYAVTYIFGLVGLIMTVQYLPKLLGIDLSEEAKRFSTSGEESVGLPDNVVLRAYRITNPEVESLSLDELRDKYWDRRSVVKVKRDDAFFPVDENGLKVGDVIEVLGPRRYFAEKVSKIAEEIVPEWTSEDVQDSAQIIVENDAVIGRPLHELAIGRRFGLMLMEIRRKGKRIGYDDNTVLGKNDVITVLGTPHQIEAMGEFMGKVERDGVETDMITLSFGIVIGLLIGTLSVTVGGVSIGLGSAGGLLVSGLFIGFRRSIKPTFGQLPEATRWFLMEFGLLLFMAGVGMRAGSGIIGTLQQNGLTLVIAGICVTIIPILVGYFVGRRFLKISPALIFGAITGAMTSGAALSVVIKEAKSPVPALGYTGTYAFANVLLVIAGSLIMIF